MSVKNLIQSTEPDGPSFEPDDVRIVCTCGANQRDSACPVGRRIGNHEVGRTLLLSDDPADEQIYDKVIYENFTVIADAYIRRKLLRNADPKVLGLMVDAAAIQLVNDAAADRAKSIAKFLKQHMAQEEEYSKPVKAQLDQLHKLACQIVSEHQQPLQDSYAGLNARLAVYLKQKQDAIDAENKARAEAAQKAAQVKRDAEIAAAKAEAARLLKERDEACHAGETQKMVDAEIDRKKAAAAAKELKQAPLQVEQVILLEQPKTGLRENWEVEITNFILIPTDIKDEVLKSEKGWELLSKHLKGMAKKLKQRFSVAGVRAYEGVPTLPINSKKV